MKKDDTRFVLRMSTLRATLKESRNSLQTRPVRLEIKTRADRTSAAHDTLTHSKLEDSCTPHSDTTPRYTRTLLPDTHCIQPKLHAHFTLGHTLPYSRTVLSDTPELRIHAPIPCAPTLHYFTVRAPDSYSLKDEHTTNSWSVLHIRVVFLLLLQLFFFFLTNYCSHPEV